MLVNGLNGAVKCKPQTWQINKQHRTLMSLTCYVSGVFNLTVMPRLQEIKKFKKKKKEMTLHMGGFVHFRL